MARTPPQGFSALQIGLHWTVAALVAFQLLGHGGMESAWRAFRRGTEVAASDTQFAYLHIAAGVLIFVLALWRVRLRFTRGAPALPASEPKIFRLLANGTHVLFYVLLIGMPISGSVAWFFGVPLAARVHGLAETALLALIALHLAGVLAQFFIFKSNVPSRMLIADETPTASGR